MFPFNDMGSLGLAPYSGTGSLVIAIRDCAKAQHCRDTGASRASEPAGGMGLRLSTGFIATYGPSPCRVRALSCRAIPCEVHSNRESMYYRPLKRRPPQNNQLAAPKHANELMRKSICAIWLARCRLGAGGIGTPLTTSWGQRAQSESCRTAVPLHIDDRGRSIVLNTRC